MNIYRMNADENGTDSIQAYINDGRVTDLECPTFEAFDQHRVELQRKIVPGDIIILDTITRMLETTRTDRQLGNEIDAPLWEPVKVNKYFGDKEYLAVYNMAAQLTMRALHNLRARGAQIIVIAHESEVKDPMAGMKMAGPNVNPAMVDNLIGASSDVFRLVNLTTPLRNDTGEVVLPADTRVLYLRRTDDMTAKFQVARELSAGIPKAIVDPTMQKLYETLGKRPAFLTVYGHPGAGKSTFACTAADA